MMNRSANQEDSNGTSSTSVDGSNTAGGFVLGTSGVSRRRRIKAARPGRSVRQLASSGRETSFSAASSTALTTTQPPRLQEGSALNGPSNEVPHTSPPIVFGASMTSTSRLPSLAPPYFPVLPQKPIFSSNREEFQSKLEQWVQEAESSLNRYMAKVEGWEENKNAGCKNETNAIDKQIEEKKKEITCLEKKKNLVQLENIKEIAHARRNANDIVAKCQLEVSDTRGIVESLASGPKKPATANEGSSLDQKDDENNNKSPPPTILCCPITLQLMTDPVIVWEDGHTYERRAILEHWSTQEAKGIAITSPKTNQQIPSKQLAPNVLVRSQCREWQEQHPNNSP